MRNKAPLAALSLLLTATLACSFGFDLPDFTGSVRPVGQMQTRQLSVPLPEQEPAELELDFAMGQLRLRPGAEDNLVEGSASWNVDELEPNVLIRDNGAIIASGEIGESRRLNLDLYRPDEVRNEWDLALAPVPMRLSLSAGAYEGRLELGGLALQRLDVSSGASDLRIGFGELNPIEMQSLNLSLGASSVELTGLGNARFQRMSFDGGAGSFELDFGEILIPAEVDINAAFGSIEIGVSGDSQVELIIEGALADVNVPASFSRSGNRYRQTGGGPQLTLTINVGAGSLDVVSR